MPKNLEGITKSHTFAAAISPNNLLTIFFMETSIINRLKDLLSLTERTTERLNAEIEQGITRPNVPILLAEMNACQSFLDSLTEQQKKDYAPYVEIIEGFRRLSSSYATTWIAMTNR